MYYRYDPDLLYLAHPRTASRATAQALQTWAGFNRYPTSDEADIPHHATVDETGVMTRDYTVFTAVRNPWAAVVSWYRLVHNPGQNFVPEWLDAFREDCSPYLVDGRLWELHRPAADVVLRFETLEQDLNDLLWAHGLDPLKLPRVSDHDDEYQYPEYYTVEMREAVGEMFADEIDELGYTFWETGCEGE